MIRIGINPSAIMRTIADGENALYAMSTLPLFGLILSAMPVQPLFLTMTSTPKSADL